MNFNFNLDIDHGKIQQTQRRSPPSTATVFKGGPIITMACGMFSPVEALAVKSGTVVVAGSLTEALAAAGPEATLIDLGGKCILPGFVEPHLHLQLTALAKYFLVDLSPPKVIKRSDAVDALRARAQHVPKGSWVAAFGYDPSRVEDYEELDIAALNSASTDHPILVINQSGHIGYVNQMAFNVAGITDTTKPPSGGAYVHDKNGHLTGVLLEPPAIGMFSKLIPPPPAIDLIQSCRQTLDTWARTGCTTVFDAGIGTVSSASDSDVKLITAVTASAECPVRFTGAMTPDVASLVGAQKPPFQAGGATLRSIKFWTDGSTQGFSAAVREPYRGRRGYGILELSDWQLREEMVQWNNLGWQLLVHSNGDRATDQTLAAYDAIQNSQTDSQVLHRIEHFTVTKPEQLEEARRLGLGVSHTIGHVYYWGQTFRDYVLGNERAERIDPVADEITHGLTYSFHSDSPVTDVNPLLYVRTAVTRQMYQSTDVLGPNQRVTLEQALRGITINAAKHVLMDDVVGSLEVGKLADLVILDRDPRTVDVLDLDQLTVEETWLEGCRYIW